LPGPQVNRLNRVLNGRRRYFFFFAAAFFFGAAFFLVAIFEILLSKFAIFEKIAA
jgi:hypothetical protein